MSAAFHCCRLSDDSVVNTAAHTHTHTKKSLLECLLKKCREMRKKGAMTGQKNGRSESVSDNKNAARWKHTQTQRQSDRFGLWPLSTRSGVRHFRQLVIGSLFAVCSIVTRDSSLHLLLINNPTVDELNHSTVTVYSKGRRYTSSLVADGWKSLENHLLIHLLIHGEPQFKQWSRV